MVNHFTAHTLQTTVWLGNKNTVLGLENNHGLGLNTVVTPFQSYFFGCNGDAYPLMCQHMCCTQKQVLLLPPTVKRHMFS